jgi:PBSX family phage terminase large subunit
MAEQIIKEINLFPAQYDAFNFETQFGAAVGGVQSGKTFVGSLWAGKKIEEFPKEHGAIIAPTYKILQQSTLEKFFNQFPNLRKYYKEQKGVIELPTGGKVFIRSGDEPLSLEGMTLKWAWMDEAGMMKRMTWTVIRSRVSTTGGQVFMTTTPYDLGWMYQEFYMPWKMGIDKSLSFFNWRSTDNPYFPKAYYEQEKMRLRPEEFNRRYCGLFTKMEGLVWDLPEAQVINPIPEIEFRAQIVIAGIDWGFRNPAAIPVLALLDNAWYVIDEWYESGKVTAEIIQAAKNKMVDRRVQRFYPDPAEPDRIKECKDAGLNVFESNNDIKGGISHIQQLINEKRFFVFRNCKNWLDEQSKYHYPPGVEGKPYSDEPLKIGDHLMSSTRYAIHSFEPLENDYKPNYQQTKVVCKKYYPGMGF